MRVRGLTNAQVAERWARHDGQGYSAHMSCEGDTLYSYAEPIAKWHGSVALITSERFSVTTSMHTSLARRNVQSFHRYFDVPSVQGEHSKNLAYFQHQWQQQSLRALRARDWTGEYLEQREDTRERCAAYCAAFSLALPAFVLPEDVQRKLSLKMALRRLNGEVA